jgi:hypothetical protein
MPPGGPQGRNGATGSKKSKGRPRVVRDIRNRRLVRRVDVRSVLKVSFVFYLCVLAAVLVAGVILWNVATTFGVIKSIDKLVRSLFALSSFQIHPMAALGWGAAVGGLLCLLGVLFNVVAAVLYNLISDVVGGIQVIVVSDEDG